MAFVSFSATGWTGAAFSAFLQATLPDRIKRHTSTPTTTAIPLLRIIALTSNDIVFSIKKIGYFISPINANVKLNIRVLKAQSFLRTRPPDEDDEEPDPRETPDPEEDRDGALELCEGAL
jgi:hypothetical protein